MSLPAGCDGRVVGNVVMRNAKAVKWLGQARRTAWRIRSDDMPNRFLGDGHAVFLFLQRFLFPAVGAFLRFSEAACGARPYFSEK